jgi:hypothetical protein
MARLCSLFSVPRPLRRSLRTRLPNGRPSVCPGNWSRSRSGLPVSSPNPGTSVVGQRTSPPRPLSPTGPPVRGQGSLREYYRVWRGSGRCPGELAACQAAFILPCLLRQERCSIIKAKYAPLTDSVEYREGKLKKQVVNW